MSFKESSNSSFVITEVDALNRCVVVEDKHFGLQIKVGYGDSELSNASISGPYEITFFYANGTSRNMQFLS